MKYRRTKLRFLVYAIALTVLIAWQLAPKTLGSGCSEPSFDGNPAHFNVGPAPRSIVTADFNHDGKIDQAVANFGGGGIPNGSVTILMNNGSGGFSTTQTIPIGIDVKSIVKADFNNDMNPDLAVLHFVDGNCCTQTFVTIMLSDAAGQFTAGAPISVSNDSLVLTTADFNLDGKADLAATSSVGSGSVAVLLGNGAGGFGPPTTFPITGNDRDSLASGDFNNDNKPDLVFGNGLFSVRVLPGDGAGGFGPQISSPLGFPVSRITVADLNQDSRPDIVATSGGNTVVIGFGNGNGTFCCGRQFEVSSNPQDVWVQDFNGDGRPDIATANGMTNNVSVLLADGSGGFGAATNYLGGLQTTYVTSADFDGDGKADLAIANSFSNDVYILNGDGAGHFLGHRSYNVGLYPFSLLSPLFVASGDFNDDGKADLVTTNFNHDSVSVLLGDGLGGFGPDVKYPAGPRPADVKVSDFNEDGKLDLVVTSGNFFDGGGGSILLGQGNGQFGSPTAFIAGRNSRAVVAADLNEDGHIDLAVVNNLDNDVSILLGNGDGTFGGPVNIFFSGAPVDLVAGDLNGDGHTDLVIAAGAVFVLLGNGAGDFQPGATAPGSAGTLPFSLALDDVNGDGFVDVAANNGGVSVWLGDGSGGFGTPTVLSGGAGDVAFGDFNSDGKPDVVSSINNLRASIWLGDGAGVFGSPTVFTIGRNVNRILAADVSGDQKTDLVVADFQSSTLAVFLNTCFAAPVVPPGLIIDSVAPAEGDSGQTNATFTVSLSSNSDQTVAVSYHTVPGSASSGVDYQAVSGRLLFPPGTTSRTVSVPVNGDVNFEPDETFFVNLSSPVNATILEGHGGATIFNDDAEGGFIGFSQEVYPVGESAGVTTITVNRSNDLSRTATVQYATRDYADFVTEGPCASNISSVASSRCDYTSASGTLRFEPGETSKTFQVLISQDSYVEGPQSFALLLANPTGGARIIPGSSTARVEIEDDAAEPATNPIDNAGNFVRQHYHDFLNREPDAAGLAFWTNQITECEQPGATCNASVRRINVSAAFFLSAEFQETGFLVYRFYKAGYFFGLPVPVRLSSFLEGTQQIGRGVIIGQPGALQQLEINKAAYALDFVSSSVFTTQHPTTLTPARFVAELFANAGITPSAADREAAVNEFGGAANSADTAARARALRRVAENPTLKQQETNRAFVLMQYFGYLRRNPNDRPEQNQSFDGYNFWLNKLNQFNGNFVDAEMVKAFILSGEYRQRFGP